ncbi:hypothetical protein ACK8OR_09635 [Jannaschia sp. KMU-145]|uniref:hypothetical protein n=1 Tax=Jannaschia halovivens TaxID=3388667 RepID=UPI00396AFBF3
MIRIAIVLALLASPAAAQTVTGACTDGSIWTGSPGDAGLGPCESPGEGFFRLRCDAGSVVMNVESPYPIAEDQRGTVDLTVDGTVWRLEGVGRTFDRTDTRGLAAVAVPTEALDALAAGSTARLDMPTETRPFHLTGSGAALAALRDAC